MITGECAYDDCDEPLFLASPDDTEERGIPMWEQHECQKCKRVMWTYHSRVDPKSYTEANFLIEHEVDLVNHAIVRRNT